MISTGLDNTYFDIKQDSTYSPRIVFMCFRRSGDYFPKQDWSTCLSNADAKSILWGRNRIFKYCQLNSMLERVKYFIRNVCVYNQTDLQCLISIRQVSDIFVNLWATGYSWSVRFSLYQSLYSPKISVKLEEVNKKQVTFSPCIGKLGFSLHWSKDLLEYNGRMNREDTVTNVERYGRTCFHWCQPII